MKKKNLKYLVRPRDYHIFEIDNSNGCYRSYEKKRVKNRFKAYEHFTFENLTKNYNFFPITKEDIPKYIELNHTYHTIMSKYLENDGHGGIKGADHLSDGEREFIGL